MYQVVSISMTITSKFDVSLHFWLSWPTVRHAPPPLPFKNTSSISDSKRGPQWLIFRQALRSLFI
jgi:hypothetical protein